MTEAAADILPEAESEVSPEDVPLPTSSMITVRLSDIPVCPDDVEAADQDASQEASIPRSSPSSPRFSRSSSQTSDSSTSVNSVDWAGLEKTEEQEPKDEATDEVRDTNSTIGRTRSLMC